MEALVALAEAGTIPVVEHVRLAANFPTGHPLHAGFLPPVAEADLIIAIECPVPWIPRQVKPTAEVIHIASDPLYRDIPFRGFPNGHGARRRSRGHRGGARQAARAARHAVAVEERALARASARDTITKSLVSHVPRLARRGRRHDLNEYNLNPHFRPAQPTRQLVRELDLERLGWALGAASRQARRAPPHRHRRRRKTGRTCSHADLGASRRGVVRRSFLTIVFNESRLEHIKRAYLIGHPPVRASRKTTSRS